MYDFLKIGCKDPQFAKALYNNPLLDFSAWVQTKTGLISNNRIARHHNLKFEIKGSYVQISGSFHYYWNIINNKGWQNYNDFTLKEFTRVIDYLGDKFGINPGIMRVHNFEYGYNLSTPFNPNKFLDSLIILKNQRFRELVDTNSRERYKGAKFNQYILKAYNKGAQNHLDINILRIELKFVTMAAFVKAPVYLSGLLNPDIITKCHEKILKTINSVIIKEKVDMSKMTKPERDCYINGIQPDYWTELYDHTSDTHIPVNRIKERKDYFNSIIVRHGQQHFKQTVASLLEDKYAWLNEMI